MKASSVLLVIASSALVSCDCPFVDCCPGDHLVVDLWVHDAQGRSMLDPNTPGYFNPDSVRLFSLIDGQLKLQTSQDGWQRPYKVGTSGTGAKIHGVIRAYIDPPTSMDAHTTVIKWSDSDSDTVDFEVRRKCDVPDVKTVWYNGTVTHERSIDVAK